MKRFCAFFLLALLLGIHGITNIAEAQDASTWMPDANLRGAVRSALGLANDEALEKEGMTQLTELWASKSNISDITGLEHATNLETLSLWRNNISNSSPIEDLTNLTYLRLARNNLVDISSLSGLTALTSLGLQHNNIVDVAPLANLVNLTWLRLAGNSITDLSALVTLVNVTDSDVDLPDPDTTPPDVSISGFPSGLQNSAFDVTITFTESVSDFVESDMSLSGTATASITAWIANSDNTVYIATITPTASGTVIVNVNADVATDATGNPNTAATAQTVTVDVDRPAVTIDVPSVTQIGAFDATITFSEAVSGFAQSDVSLNGSVTSITAWHVNSDNTVYTATITPTASGTVTISVAPNVATDAANNPNTAATAQTVSIDVDNPDVDGPGVSISVNSYNTSGYGAPISPVVDAIPLVTVTFTKPVRRDEFDPRSALTFSGPTMTINIAAPMSDRCSEVTVDGQTIRLCSQWLYDLTVTESGELTFNIAEGVTQDLAGNSNTAATLTVTANIDRPAISSVTVPSGPQVGAFNMTIEFTEPVSPGGTGLWGPGRISSSDLTISSPAGLSYSATFTDEEVDRTTYILTLTPNNGRWSMDGQIRITAIYSDTVKDAARNLNLQQSLSESVSPYVSVFRYSPYDMDKDDDVDIYDVKIVVQALGQSGDAITDPRTDIDADDDVDKDDVLAVIDNVGTAVAAPASADIFADLSPEIYKALNPILLTETLDAVRLESDGSLKYLQAIVLLEHLLAEMRPDETQLLANYPNPFNPETWIPYHLAKSSDVRITIYDVRGSVVRLLELGHLSAGYYISRNRAAYWDGRNAVGERVASGIYFYQLRADNMSLLRKMLILK